MWGAFCVQKQLHNMNITKVCAACGSEDVSKDALAEWHAESGKWVLKQLFEQEFCHADCCDGETTVKDWQGKPEREYMFQTTAIIRSIEDWETIPLTDLVASMRARLDEIEKCGIDEGIEIVNEY